MKKANQNKLSCVIIGMGYMGKKHFEAYLKNSNVLIKGLVVKTLISKKELEKRYNIPIFQDYKKAINERGPDIVSICTPTNTHFEISKFCLEKKISILVEKPFTKDNNEIHKLIEISKTFDSKIQVANTELFNSKIMQLIKLIKKEKSTLNTIIIKKYGEDISQKENNSDFISNYNKIFNRLFHLLYILPEVSQKLPKKYNLLELNYGYNKEDLESELVYNNFKVKISSHFNSTFSLYKEISFLFKDKIIRYILYKGKERIICQDENNKKEIKVRQKNMYENMINLFVNNILENKKIQYSSPIKSSLTRSIIIKILDEKNSKTKKIINQRKREQFNSYLLRPSLICNQKCLFCNVFTEKDFKQKSYSELITEVSNKKIDDIVISGGEPTLLKHIFSLVSYLKYQKKIEIVRIQSNAMLCSDKTFCLKLKLAGLDETLISLHSHNPQISDLLTGKKGSWKKTVEGIKNLNKLGIKVRIAHVLTTKNYKQLNDFIVFVKDNFPNIKGVDILLNQHRGRGEFYPKLLPKLSEIKKYVDKAVVTAGKNITLNNPYTIPLCFFNPKNSLEYKLLKENKNTHPQIISLKNNKRKSNACNKCKYDTLCLGVWKGYKKVHGLEELKPIK